MDQRKKTNDELTDELRILKDEFNYLKSLDKKNTFKLKQIEKTLRENELKFRFLFNGNPLPNWIYNRDNLSFLEVNESAVEQFGYSREEFLSMTLNDIQPKQIVSNLFQKFKLKNYSRKIVNQTYVKNDGELIFAEVCLFPMVRNNSNIIHAIIYNITTRSKSEKELHESEINFRRSIYESPVGIRIDTYDDETVFVNRALLDIFGINSLEEFRNLSITDLYTSESYLEHIQRKERRNKGEEILEYEISLRWNEKIRHFKVSRMYVLWEGDTHFQVVMRDITKYREAVDKLSLYSKVVERSTNTICISNSEGIIEYVNPKILEVTGYSKEEMLGANTRIFRSGLKPKEEYTELWNTIKSGKVWSGELCNKKKNGELYWESVTISPVFDNFDRITHFFSIKVDVTEHKKMVSDLLLAKEYAEEREIFLRTFIENIPFEIWVCDMNNFGIIENKKHVDHFGSILGQDLLLKSLNNKETFLQKSKIERLLKGEIIDEECYCSMSKERKIFQQIAFPIFKKTEIIGMAGLNIDITERRSAELAVKTSAEELRRFATHLQVVREEEKSGLAREIHDDLGQILVALKIDFGLLKQQIERSNSLVTSETILAKLDELTMLINNAAYSARRIMNGLRHEKLESLGLEAAIREYIQNFIYRYQKDCEFKCTISKEEIDQQQTLGLFRIFQESMTNIVKHSRATLVKILIESSVKTISMEIKDNGIGFNKKKSGRKDSYGIIGMKERVFLLNGKLNVTSRLGKGTCVKVEIPSKFK